MEQSWLSSTLEVIPLGAGCEVGRSCILLRYRGRQILFDCGIHPAHVGLPALPVFDEINLADVELCLVTHFHLDHCGAIPYILRHTWFKGKVIMTEPTKAISHLVWMDYTGLAEQTDNEEKNSNVTGLYSETDVRESMDLVETMHFGQTRDYNGIQVICYGAGHVVGACMFAVKIGGINVLYTGDYSAENDRHVPKATLPPSFSVQLLICEATYGIRKHEERKARERRFLYAVENVVASRQGKCLLPIFALGRVQELLLILDDHWAHRPHLQHIPIFYLSALSDKGMTIMREYAATYGGEFVKRKSLKGQNCFNFQFVKSAKRVDEISHYLNRDGPCVILAAPGMLQSGPSRKIFEMLAPDRRNGVVLTGYTLRNTLADQLKGLPSSIQRFDGKEIPVRLSLEIISFSAHADFQQTSDLIDSILPPSVVLVHGEKTEIRALKDKLTALRPSLAVFAPQTLQRVCLEFRSPLKCSVVGDLVDDLQRSCKQAQLEDQSLNLIQGLLVARPNDVIALMKESDLKKQLGLKSFNVKINTDFGFCFTSSRWSSFRQQLETMGDSLSDVPDAVPSKPHCFKSFGWMDATLLPHEEKLNIQFMWSKPRESKFLELALHLLGDIAEQTESNMQAVTELPIRKQLLPEEAQLVVALLQGKCSTVLNTSKPTTRVQDIDSGHDEHHV